MKLLRGLLFVVVGLGVVGFIGFNLFKPQIAERAFNRAISENMGRNIIAELPDGLHVFICGSGSPLATAERAGPCTGVIAGTQVFIFDVGSGSPRKLGRMAFPISAVKSVYLTHLHSDHIDSLGELMLQAWVGRTRTTPLPVAGPVGTAEVVSGFNSAYRIDSTYRTAHHGAEIAPPDGFGGQGIELEVSEAAIVVYNDGGVKITAVEVSHEPVAPAFGYRIDYGGRSVTISGDTIYDDRFVALSKDADLMLHEALQPKMVEAMRDAAGENGITNIETILGDILDYHTSPEDAARAAETAGAGQLILTHIVPPLPVKLLYPLFLGDAGQNYSGDIIIAEDGMLITLPADSKEVKYSKAF